MKKKEKRFEFTFVHFIIIVLILNFIAIISLNTLLSKKNEIENAKLIDNVKKIYEEVNSKDNSGVLKYSDRDYKISDNYNDLNYCIILNDLGKIDKIVIGNDKRYIINKSVSDLDSIINEKIINEKYPFTVCNNIIFSDGNDCTFNNGIEPKSGDEYTDGMFLYKYNYELVSKKSLKEDLPSVSFEENEEMNGWGVSLVNRTSKYTGDISVCTTINDKPVVSMKNLFAGYTFESDFSNFDTRNVKNMSYMFYYYHGNKNLDLNTFNTDNVENMSYMFDNSAIKVLDIRSFNINKNTKINNILTNNRLLTKIKVKDEETKKLLEKSTAKHNKFQLMIK